MFILYYFNFKLSLDLSKHIGNVKGLSETPRGVVNYVYMDFFLLLILRTIY